MNLQLADQGKPFTVTCVGCRRAMLAGNKDSGEAVYADLDGKPFEDYYCAVCAGDARCAGALDRAVAAKNRNGRGLFG